ncbi:hypothetical protein Tsubulata_030309 [Turnera subulata]|uniref:Tify domain-containing protein n=1 Tax=Turnera subulata TaxID=218843 RepID=A0A9Q0IYP4_9ROSI|nr:hypothetical protein Tsubulata_030309 [Turnera subulata]
MGLCFQNQGFWMAKDAGGVNNAEVNYDNSPRIEQKRSHQWFMDGAETELFSNKKQAVAVAPNTFFAGMLNSNVSSWSNPSSFQPITGQFPDRLYDSETSRNFDDRSIGSVTTEKVNTEPFGNDSSFGLSISHTLEDPRSGLNYGGIRKVKVSQVKEAETIMPLSTEHAFSRVDNNAMPTSHSFDKIDENAVSMGLAYNKGDGNFMSIGETYDRESNVFISMGQNFAKVDDGLSMSQPYRDSNQTISISHNYGKADDSIISMGQMYNKADEHSISMGHIFNKEDGGAITLGQVFNKDESNNLSIGHSYGKGESTIISFGGYDDDGTNPSEKIMSGYELLMTQPSLQRSQAINDRELVNSNADVLVSSAHIISSGAENVSKKKDDLKTAKKVPPNNFPSNVRSLLSTGMLDGVPVKYIAWSREKELRGVIKGSGYLCGCQTCNFSKVINAYEFERHASCKTKHPNNHIYFENGKTIYGIVQELRSTPQNMLFEVIQTITGSPINQKSFRLWKGDAEY